MQCQTATSSTAYATVEGHTAHTCRRGTWDLPPYPPHACPCLWGGKTIPQPEEWLSCGLCNSQETSRFGATASWALLTSPCHSCRVGRRQSQPERSLESQGPKCEQCTQAQREGWLGRCRTRLPGRTLKDPPGPDHSGPTVTGISISAHFSSL